LIGISGVGPAQFGEWIQSADHHVVGALSITGALWLLVDWYQPEYFTARLGIIMRWGLNGEKRPFLMLNLLTAADQGYSYATPIVESSVVAFSARYFGNDTISTVLVLFLWYWPPVPAPKAVPPLAWFN